MGLLDKLKKKKDEATLEGTVSGEPRGTTHDARRRPNTHTGRHDTNG